MGNLSDIPGNLRTDDGAISDEGSTLASQNTAGFRSLQALLAGGLGQENQQVEIKTVKLNHGVAAGVKLNKLLRARGAYVLSVGSADGKTRHSLARPVEIIGSSRSQSVKIQASFLDTSATNVPVTVALVPDGNSSQLPVSDLTWTALPLINGFANFGGGFQTASYLRDPHGFIHLRGLITHAAGAAANTIAAVLPAGFRPLQGHSFWCTTEVAGAGTRCDVAANGGINPSVNVATAAGGLRSLAGLTFDSRS